MIKTILIIVLLSSVACAQDTYARRDQEIVVAGIEYARVDERTLGGAQIAITPDGRSSFGIDAAIASSPNASKSLGIFCAIALEKPTETPRLGVDLLLSASVLWQWAHVAGSQDFNVAGTGESAGLELYVPVGSFAIPFFQVVQMFGSFGGSGSASFLSMSFGSDFVIGTDDRPALIITPGMISNNFEKLFFVVDVTFVLDCRTTPK